MSGPSDAGIERSRRRFARRQWARRWRGWRWALAAALIVASLATGVWLVFYSSALAVAHVAVRGVDHLTTEQVVAAADVSQGQPLARVDLVAIEARVRTLAPVAAAEVTRAWPDTISIDVDERTAVAVVSFDGRLRGVDGDGVVFRDYRSRPPDLPLVESDLSADADSLAEAAGVAAALPAGLAEQVDFVRVDTIDDISLVLRDGRVVVWGSAAESELKAEVLTRLLSEKGSTYDVSVPGRPTIRD